MATDKPRFTITIDDETLGRVTEYKRKQKISTQSKAIASLVQSALSDLEADGKLPKAKNAPSISDEAKWIAKRYDALDDHGKEMVSLALDCEARRMEDDRQRPEKVVELFPTRKYLQSASAGYGDFNDDASYEMVDLVKRPPVGTSFIITVNGNSMEPTYHDGDQLFVRAQERVALGDIGLFTQGPKLYIKESGPDGLVSHNKEYGLITGTEDEPIRAQGKVLGVCTADYLLH